jgi:hypothetical protein
MIRRLLTRHSNKTTLYANPNSSLVSIGRRPARRQADKKAVTLREASVPSKRELLACSIRCGYLVLDIRETDARPIKFRFK